MSVLDALLSKKPEERTVAFCLDPDLAERHRHAKALAERLRSQSENASTNAELAARAEDAALVLEELEAKLEGSLVRFTFRAIDGDTFDRLKAKHRPTETERTEARKIGQPPPEWGRAFQPALVAACCVNVDTPEGSQPGLSEEEVAAIWSSASWNQADRAELFHSCLATYMTRTKAVLDTGKDLTST
jgi:hypothetical protein